MKAITTHLITNAKERELFIKLVLLSTITIGVCSNMKNKGAIVGTGVRPAPIEVKDVDLYVDTFGDFDQVKIPNKTPVIASMISTLKPGLTEAYRNEVASNIQQALKKYKIRPQIVLAIIDTESDFNQDAVSSTGDISMAQINVEVWNREFERMNAELIDAERLKEDKTYTMEQMGRILLLLKKRYEKVDRRWYARYHSGTKKHKHAYLTKLERRMKKLEMAQSVAIN